MLGMVFLFFNLFFSIWCSDCLFGIVKGQFHRILKDYNREFDFDIIVLLESSVSGVKANGVIKNFEF